MLRASLRSLWARKFRLLMSVSAIVLGVAFVTGSLVFSDTLRGAFQGILNGTVADVNVFVKDSETFGTAEGSNLTPEDVEKVRQVSGVKSVTPMISLEATFVIDKQGKIIGGSGAPSIGFTYHEEPAYGGAKGLRIVQGHAPSGHGEVVLDPYTLERSGYKIGDEISLATTGDKPIVKAKIVGVASYQSGSMVGATLAMMDLSFAQEIFFDGKEKYTDLWVVTAKDADPEAVAEEINKVLPPVYEAETGKEITKLVSKSIQEGLQFITTFLLVFAGVALVVGSFLIMNTFAMLIAQRTRELALLRALGASKRQVLSSVMMEAFALGVVGSILGVLVGIGIAKGISALFGQIGLDLSGSPLVITGKSILVGLIVGVIVTLIAALLPALRSGRISPMAALRDDGQGSGSSLRWRTIISVVILAGSVGMLIWAVRTEAALWISGLSMLLILIAVVLLSPWLARPLITALSRLGEKPLGAVAVLARENSIRNPRRTAATSSSLMIGLTLVSMMTVFGDSATASVDKAISENWQGDYAISGPQFQPISATIGDRISSVPGVKTVSRITQVPARLPDIDDARTSAWAVNWDGYQEIYNLKFKGKAVTELAENELVVTADAAEFAKLSTGQDTRLTIKGTSQTFRVAGIMEKQDGMMSGYFFSRETAAKIGAPKTDSMITVILAPDANRAEVDKDLRAIVADSPVAQVNNQKEFAAQQRKGIDQLLFLIYALLGLSLIISVMGIINTLALSVLERTREIGLLRAVGLTKGQLRTMVRLEAVAISAVGGLLGLVLGTVFGVVLQKINSDEGVTVLNVEYGKLALLFPVAVLVGVLAAWWPARRAAQMNVLEAIATE